MKQLPVRLALWAIQAYRFAISPLLGSNCRYTPTCSAYTMVALERFGFFRGLGLGVRRVLRCHPWHEGAGVETAAAVAQDSGVLGCASDAVRSAGQG